MDVQLHRNGDYWLARWRNSENRRCGKSLGHIDDVPKTKALRLCRELGAEMISRPSLRDRERAPTLAAWREHYTGLRRHELKDGTLALHAKTWDYLVDFAGKDTRLDKVTPTIARKFRGHLLELRDDKGQPVMGEQTACSHIRNAKVFFGMAVEDNVVGENPFAKVKSTPPRLAKDWAEVGPADMAKIIEACPSTAWRALFILTRWAGLRRGEALRATWSDFDWMRRLLLVLPEEDCRGSRVEGTKQRGRFVPLAPSAYDPLRQAFEEAPAGSRGPCSDIGANNVDRDARAIIRRAVGFVYKKPFHTLRKCCGTEWADRVPLATVADYMGNSVAVAAGHYVRPSAGAVEIITEHKAASGINKAQNQDNVL